MPSSISSSDQPDAGSGARQVAVGAKQVGADELPSATWVERKVPSLPRWLLLAVALVAAVGTLAWEVKMRAIGLTTSDLGDGPGHWAAERRIVDRGEAEVVIVGDSRILFDTDLALLQRMIGKRVVQLAVVGTNASFLLENLANDEDFRGIALVGITELSYFRPAANGPGLAGKSLGHYDTQSPAQRSGHALQVALSRAFAFIDEGHRLSKLAVMPYWPRGSVRSPYDNPWKVFVTEENRQTWMWETIWENPWRLAQARRAWNDFAGPPVPPEVIEETIARSKKAIAAIRARGGDVVYLRPPSVDPVLSNELQRAPRAAVWDRLVRETATVGLYFADDPSLTAMDAPEYSHLSPVCARHYTWAYAKALRERVPSLGAHAVDVDALKPVEPCVAKHYAAAPRPPFPQPPAPAKR